MRGQTYIISALVFALIVAIFAVINGDAVTVNYLFGTGQVPLILVILISTLLGGLITGAFGLFRLLKLQRTLRVLQKENETLKGNAIDELSEDTSVKDQTKPGEDNLTQD
ncbi:LapA family protein [Paraliobacillus salinarum]|uniref:LapA family protein n=1 Tax=Paraliobacillus salinarum TaxID=1158996 RepID=UPI0015F69F41|nr:lipopolysaccharide assembly protein LapA domain-containing protein [Paraliobacillus salinarum]